MKVASSILSILEKNKENAKEKINLLNQTDCEYLHLDIIDGIFVEGKVISDAKMLDLISDITKPFDVHLMVEDIEKYITTYQKINPEYITFHIEATAIPSLWISKLKELGIGIGIALSPNTKIEVLTPYLDQVDLVLVMSVEPGKGGQSFIENTMDKIAQLKALKETYDYHYQIEVDGGINANTILKAKFADIVVSGSFITNAPDYQKQINLLRIK